MKFKLPIIGEINTGKDTEVEPVVQTVEVKEKIFLGSFLDLFRRPLSDEKKISERLILSFAEWVYANVSVLSEEVSKLTPKLYKRRLVGGEVVLDEIDQHPLLDRLDKFNETTTASDGFYVTEAHLDLTGDAFWLLDGEQIYILQPDRVELDLDDGNTNQIVKGYKYKYRGKEGKTEEKYYDAEEILHIKVPNPQNPYRGKSTVEAAALSIDTDTNAAETIKNFFANGMIANFALSTDKRLTPSQVKDLQAQIRASRSGTRNAFKVPVFSSGLEPKPLQMSNKEVQLIEVERWYRDKIMVMFKNTPMSLGIVEDVNRAQGESSLIEWRRSVVKPKMQRIVDAINEYLVPAYGQDLILGFDDAVPEDRKEKLEEVKSLFSGQGVKAVITLNEARDLLGYDAVSEEGADEVKQPMPDIAPVNDLNDAKQMPVPIRNVDFIKHFRRNGWYQALAQHKALHKAALKAASKIVKDRRKAKPAKRRVDNFWKRVADIIEEYENLFNQKLINFITQVVDEAQERMDNDDARATGELFDSERKLLEAQNMFAPLLLQALTLAGQEANKLIGIDEPYIPKHVKQFDAEAQIREQIEMFATSMLETDKKALVKILSDGLAEGAGIPEIRRRVQEKFAEFTKNQAERITRTEVAWAANRGIVDSYKQSGVVIGKQWLTAPDPCPICEPLQGEIVELDAAYLDQGTEWQGQKLDYRDIEEPPLHPNCRCTTVAVIEGLEPLLEPKSLDRRTKLYKRIKSASS